MKKFLSLGTFILGLVILGSFFAAPVGVEAISDTAWGTRINDAGPVSGNFPQAVSFTEEEIGACEFGAIGDNSIEGKLFVNKFTGVPYCLISTVNDVKFTECENDLAGTLGCNTASTGKICVFQKQDDNITGTSAKPIKGICVAPSSGQCATDLQCVTGGMSCVADINPDLAIWGGSSCKLSCKNDNDCGSQGPHFTYRCVTEGFLINQKDETVGVCLKKEGPNESLKPNDQCLDEGGMSCEDGYECREYNGGDAGAGKKIGTSYCETPYRPAAPTPEKKDDKATFGPTVADDVRMAEIHIPIGELTKFEQPLVSACRGKVLQENIEVECLQIPWIAQYIGAAYKFGAAFGALLAVMVMMIGGILYIMGGANAAYISSGKEYIVQAVFGLVLILGSFLILNILNPNLTNLPVIEIERVARVETLCCQLAPAQQGVVPVRSIETAQPVKKGEQPKCSNGSDPLQPSKCAEGAAVGGYCCLDPQSPSNQACTSLSSGGEQYRCLPVADEDGACGVAAKVIAGGSTAVLVGAVAPGIALPVLEGVGKATVAGAKAGVSLTLKCVSSKACLATAGTAAILASMNAEASCNIGRAGVCTKVEGYKQLENGDICNSDDQCKNGKCVPGLSGLQCWGVNVGFCSNGTALPVDRNGGGGCDDTKIGLKPGTEAGCADEEAVCAYFKPTNTLFVETKLGACSLGELGHACGGVPSICKDDLKCNDDGICVPIGGFLPPGTTYKCTSNAMCASGFAFCDSDLDLKCKDSKNDTPAGCIDAEDAISGNCVSKREIGTACVDDIQCLSGLCDENLGSSEEGSGLCACAPKIAKGCKVENEVCVAEAGKIGSCVDYKATKKTVAVDATGSIIECSGNADCLSNDCSAEYQGKTVCDCDDATASSQYDQCPVGWTCRDLDSFGDGYDDEACVSTASLKLAGASCSNGSECRSGGCENSICTCEAKNDCPANTPICLDNGSCSTGEIGQVCTDETECLAAVCSTDFDIDVCLQPPTQCTATLCTDEKYKTGMKCEGGGTVEQTFCDCDAPWTAVISDIKYKETIENYFKTQKIEVFTGITDCAFGYACMDLDSTGYQDNDICMPIGDFEKYAKSAEDKKRVELMKQVYAKELELRQSGQ